ncbi:sigma-70 family RNA polymerase sigma factor [Amycolatopsis sp. NPDC026612]|uniref:sigma-70 family RNA polymerase sigma factor n=1 Tax=Amycolatopsis sp. NPDC026612 TaxID=3155466 RepID=UPI00340BBB27
MDDLAAEFEAERGRLRGLAHRMLGSAAEADDAVQEAWLRLQRVDSVGNLAAWLTTVVSRVCLDVLRSRKARREEPFDVFPEPVDDADPAAEAALADSVGRALLVVLDALGPAERIAFVLHDLFEVPFDRIGPVLDRTPVAAKKLASRARQRVRGTSPLPPADLARHRRVVDSFLAAARGGDLAALLDVLAPDVVRRADAAALPAGAALETRGARAVAEETQVFGKRARFAEPALVDGAVGLVVAPRGRLVLALAVTVEGERVAAYEVIADPARLAALHVTLLSA